MAYCTATVTWFEVAPPMEIVSGTALPEATPAGTMALTWYRPTKPGARPENNAFSVIPPMVTVASSVVGASAVVEAAAPVAGWFALTGPRPVQ